MVLDPFLLVILLLLTALGFIVSLFLPSIIEILKPRDKGPRRMLRVPLQKIVRYGFKSVLYPKPDSVGNTGASGDLQDFLKETGLKTARIGNEIVRIFGNVAFPAGREISENIVVDGTLNVGDRCVLHGSAKAKGNVSIGSCVVMRGNLISTGNVDINDETVIGGLVHAEGSVRLGEKVYIGLSVVADGDVDLYENSEVKENIITRGVIKVLKCPKLDFPSAVDDIG